MSRTSLRAWKRRTARSLRPGGPVKEALGFYPRQKVHATELGLQMSVLGLSRITLAWFVFTIVINFKMHV
jgi:hypothetical protein